MQIIDDWSFVTIGRALRSKVLWWCVRGCCHSGSIMDLPYEITVTPELAAQGGGLVVVVEEEEEEGRVETQILAAVPTCCRVDLVRRVGRGSSSRGNACEHLRGV